MSTAPTLDPDTVYNASTFADQYGGYWDGEHPEHTLADWRYEVANDDTRQGYWEWCAAQDGLLAV